MSLVNTGLSLLALQVCSRLFSFGLNQILLRSTTPEVLGVSTISLDVIRDTSLFFIREGIRTAVMRTDKRWTADVANIARRPFYLSPLVALLFGLYYAVTSTPESIDPGAYAYTLALYGLSCVVELAGESRYLVALFEWEQLTPLRTRLEGCAVLIKAVATLTALRFLSSPHEALVAFGIGQLAYSSVLAVGLWLYVSFPKVAPGEITEISSAHENPGQSEPATLQTTAWAMTKQSLVKQVLTESDKLAVGRLSKIENQGGYAVALNYGSLVARILFQPIEESSRLYFSRTLSGKETAKSVDFLQNIMRVYFYLSLVFVCFARHYTFPALFYLLGSKWHVSQVRTAGRLLSTYCVYLPFLAFNGISEAFFASSAPIQWISRASTWMMFCSVAFVSSVAVLMGYFHFDETALIYANCGNMALRIAFAVYYIEAEVASIDFLDLLPKPLPLAAFTVSNYILSRYAETLELASTRLFIRYIGVGAGCGIVCLAVSAFSERKRIRTFM